MFRFMRRFWKYMGMRLNAWHEENADPKVQLEQAMREAQERHGRLVEQVTNVILDDLVAAVAPRSMTVEGQFNVRGGISSVVRATYEAPPSARRRKTAR